MAPAPAVDVFPFSSLTPQLQPGVDEPIKPARSALAALRGLK
jgi:hypothetical protein